MSTRKADMARRAALNTPIDISSPECALLAMQQHTCTYIPNVRIDCKPFWRVFSVCAGRSFEVTPFATVNETTGEATLSSDATSNTGKRWNDIPLSLPAEH